jgi:hypothetical protein
MHRHRVVIATLFALCFALEAQSSSVAAENGVAWDAVTKFSMSADAANLQPGSFDQDYAQAASVQPVSDSGGGIFGKVNQAMAMAKHMQALMQNGFAEKHYVADAKSRVDQVSEQTATITDCSARTITTLDLRKHTYKVESLDQSSPRSSSSGGAAPMPRPTDDGSRIAIVIANTAIGSKTVGGQAASGFKSDMSFTQTKPSGEKQSFNGDLLAYYSSLANPTASCFSSGLPAGTGNAAAPFAASATGYAGFMRALALAGIDKRFTLKQSGPPLPRNKFPMFEAVTIGGGRSGGGTFVTERGNVRPIGSNDPIFSVPPGFTREQ